MVWGTVEHTTHSVHGRNYRGYETYSPPWPQNARRRPTQWGEETMPLCSFLWAHRGAIDGQRVVMGSRSGKVSSKHVLLFSYVLSERFAPLGLPLRHAEKAVARAEKAYDVEAIVEDIATKSITESERKIETLHHELKDAHW
ncbi:hypothetical protein BHE74_00014624 [Ensete ventricosum]|nr:hypothetical protein BHE74_00014624 [Ensete ventricosum]